MSTKNAGRTVGSKTESEEGPRKEQKKNRREGTGRRSDTVLLHDTYVDNGCSDLGETVRRVR